MKISVEELEDFDVIAAEFPKEREGIWEGELVAKVLCRTAGIYDHFEGI